MISEERGGESNVSIFERNVIYYICYLTLFNVDGHYTPTNNV